MKWNILIFFSLLCFYSPAQSAWKRVDSKPYFFTDAIHIDQKGNFFMGIRGRFNVLWSSDQGENWVDVTSEQDLYRDQKAFFELEPGSVYYSNAESTAKFSKWDGSRFRAFDDHKFRGEYNNLIFSKDGSFFLKNSRVLYKLRPDMSFDSTLKIAEFKDLILRDFFYNDSSNFLITSTTDPGSSNRNSIYKLNVVTGDTLLLAQWPIVLGKSNVHITEAGQILVASFEEGLLFSEPSNPSRFSKVKLDSLTEVFSVLRIGKTSQGHLFVITSNGLYINYGPGINQWTRCHNISHSLPLEGGMLVHDSLTALTFETEDCLRRNCLYFNSRNKFWTKVEVKNAVHSFANLCMSGAGVMYGKMDCHSYQSIDTGKTWSVLFVHGYPVDFLTINHFGQAVALSDAKFHVFLEEKKEWISSSTTLASNTRIWWMNFYRVGTHLFLEGFDQITATVKKHYRLHSEDGGFTWRTTTAFNLQGGFTQGLHDIKVADSTEWLGYHIIKDSVMVSYDKGIVWQSSIIFSQFRLIGSIFKLQDGSYLINGAYNRNPGLYHISKTGVILKELSDFRKLINIQYFPPDDLVAYDYFNPGFVFSNDFGESIYEINQGLPDKHPDKISYQDLLYHKGDFYYSNNNDGIYILKNPFGITDVKNIIPAVENLGHVYQHGKRIFIEGNLEQYEGMRYRIINSMGVIIAGGLIVEGLISYDMNQFPAGVYLVSIFTDRVMQTNKLMIE